ncbi:MAG: hypothetical protein AB2L14_01705 [Candidatus Xenobiia bacterium LiM19]
MAGQIKKIIDTIISTRGKGDPTLISMIKTKLILKGIHPDKYLDNSPDLQPVIEKLEKLAQELGVRL